MTTSKQYKHLFSAYDKKLKQIHKTNFANMSNNMEYFITYLKMLRDYCLLNNDKKNVEELVDLRTTTLVAAVSEYEKYVNCIDNYYKLNGNTIEKKTDEPDEEVTKKYNLEKKFHWTNFWQLVMTNIEDWSING